MTYSVKEIFYTLQGEGTHAGRPAVFCRMAGCNLWTGREADRASAVCQFCDTEFVGTDGLGAASSIRRRRWPRASPRSGPTRRPVSKASASSWSRVASLCCSWTRP